MKEIHRKVLIKNRLKLARDVCCDEVMQFLVEKETLTDAMVEKIESKQTRFSKNVALLTLLPTRGPLAYEIFKKALKDSNQYHLVNLLEKSECEFVNLSQISDISFQLSGTEKPTTWNIASSSLPTNTNIAIAHNMIKCATVLDSIDGPSKQLRVVKTTLQFYHSTKNSAYKMTSRPRGYALVISVTKFDVEFSNREGSSKDQDNLVSLLDQLEYKTTLLENSTAAEMKEAVEKFAQLSDHHFVDSCFVAILSHGHNGEIFGRDGSTLKTEFLFRIFDNVHCRNLRNKPKIFLLQACRGEFPKTTGVKKSSSEQISSSGDGCLPTPITIANSNDEVLLQERLPTTSDIIVAYATTLGEPAMRNTTHGSWFVQSFVRMMSQHAQDKDFAEILTLVNGSVRKYKSHSPGTEYHGFKGSPEFHSSLCKKLYFYPGIFQK